MNCEAMGTARQPKTREGTLMALPSPGPRHNVRISRHICKASSTHDARDLAFPLLLPPAAERRPPGPPPATDVTYFPSSQPRRPGGTWNRRGRRWPRCPPRRSGAGETRPGTSQPSAAMGTASETGCTHGSVRSPANLDERPQRCCTELTAGEEGALHTPLWVPREQRPFPGGWPRLTAWV